MQSKQLFASLAIMWVSFVTCVDYTNKVVRIQENRYYLENIIVDRDESSTNATFYRYSLLTTPNYQVGLSVTVLSGSKTGVGVYLRKYASDTARTLTAAGFKLNGITDDYYDQAIIGTKGGELLENGTVGVSDTSYFSFPLVTTSAGPCSQQLLTDTYLTIDIYLPDYLVDTSDSTKPKATVMVTIHWEDTRLAPPNPLLPLDRSPPILEKPRTLVTVTSPVGSSDGSGFDQDPCPNQVTVQIRFTRPTETYVTHYWMYTTSIGDSGECSTVIPSTSDPYVVFAKADAPTLDTDANTIQYNITNFRGVVSFPFCVVVFTANQAGRDTTGVKTSKIKDYIASGTLTGCVSKKLEEDSTTRFFEDVVRWNPEAAAHAPSSYESNNLDPHYRDIQSLDYSQLFPGQHDKAASRKFTDVDAQSVTVRGQAGHTSSFAYYRSIKGYLAAHSRVHMYQHNVSSMATFNLTVSAPYLNIFNVSANQVSSGIQAVVIVGSDVARCIKDYTPAQLQQLAIDNSAVLYYPMDCTGTTTATTYGTSTINMSPLCSSNSNRIFGVNSVTITQNCTTPTSINSFFVFVVYKQNVTSGTYLVEFSGTDYTVSNNYTINGELVLTGSTLSFLQSANTQIKLVALLTSLASNSNANVTSVATRDLYTASSSASFTCTFQILSDATKISTVARSLSAITLKQVTDAIGTSITAVRIITRPTVNVVGCIVQGLARTFSIPYGAGCVHPNSDFLVYSGSVRALYLRANAVPTSIAYDALTSFPDQHVATQLSCAATSRTSATSSVAAGLWYGQVVLLDSSIETLLPTVYRAQLSLAPQEGFEQDVANGFVCCDEIIYYNLKVTARKRLRVSINLASSSAALRGVFVQRGVCPTGDISICTDAINCFFNSTISTTDNSYTVLTPLSQVQTSDSDWCVGIKALPKTETANKASYVFVNRFDATPNPTPTPQPTYDACKLNPFCGRTLVQTSETNRNGAVWWVWVLPLLMGMGLLNVL
eukprot:c12459_g1_i1.p1 GENE.c12459_g1_i1~~c12459_g1_i1.p1  ORF type:complete len:996 (-),score=166.55 c12459_g1_i1:258-3245(-)